MIIDRSGANVLWYPHPPTDPAGPTDPTESAADAALSRHPAGRSRPDGRGRGRGRGRAGRTMTERPGRLRGTGSIPGRGPDDDPEFLRQLAQRIHGTPTDPAE